MAAPSKKRVVDNEMKDLENENIKPQTTETMEEVQVDFEARNPEDSDFHGIRKLLQQQAYVEEDDESSEEDDELDVFGLVTVLNITERQKLNSVQELKSYIQENCEGCSKSDKDKLAQLLHDSNNQVGFLLNERFINIPPQIALPSFESLLKELENANKKRMKYDFTDYVMICKTLKMPDMGKNQVQRVFLNPEEEYFLDEAYFVHDFSVKGEKANAVSGLWGTEEEEDLEPFRTVIAISADKMDNIMTKMRENLSVA